MAVISGINGAVYHFQELSNTAVVNDITFGPNAIISSAIDFESTGYEAGHFIAVTNATATGNIGIYTATAVSSGTITVSETIATTGTDTGTPTIAESAPGIEKAGFYNWTLTYNNEIFDATNFYDSSGGRTYIAGITDWNATADKYFLSSGGNLVDWLGDTVKVRFFTKYVSSPTTADTAQYMEGDAIVSGWNANSPVDALITSTLNFQGDGTLTPTIRARAWTTF